MKKKPLLTRLLIAQLSILSSFIIHVQSRDDTQQVGKIILKMTTVLRQNKLILFSCPLKFYVAMIPFELKIGFNCFQISTSREVNKANGTPFRGSKWLNFDADLTLASFSQSIQMILQVHTNTLNRWFNFSSFLKVYDKETHPCIGSN